MLGLGLGVPQVAARRAASGERTYTLSTLIKLEGYDADSGFTLVGANAVKAVDTTNPVEGTGSLKLTGHSMNQTTGVTRSFGTRTKAELGTIACFYDRVTDASVQSLITVGSMTNATQITFNNEAQFMKGGRWVSQNVASEWTTAADGVSLSFSQRFGQASPFSGEMRFGAIYAAAAGRPTIVLTFDDGYATILNTVFPILEARGFKGTHYVAPSLLGTTGKMIEADLETLYEAGWDLACDGTMTDVAITATDGSDTTPVRDWLEARGYTRAMDHLCYPNGTKSQAIADGLAAAGFLTMRNTEPQTAYTRLGIAPGVAKSFPSRGFSSSTAVSTITPFVDEAISRGNTLFMHFHDIQDSPASIGWQTSKFIELMDYIKAKHNANLLDVLTISQWFERDGWHSPRYLAGLLEAESEAYPDRPYGVPDYFDWYIGYKLDNATVPSIEETPCEAISGWVQIYPRNGVETAPVGQCETRNHRVWVHQIAGGWKLVQEVGDDYEVEGGAFNADFEGNVSTEIDITQKPEQAGCLITLPEIDNTVHFWPGPRGEFVPEDSDWCYNEIEIRLTDPADEGKFIANVGCDWWLSPTADFPNNPLAGMCNWVRLSTQWKRIGFYSCSDAEFLADLPPHRIHYT